MNKRLVLLLLLLLVFAGSAWGANKRIYQMNFTDVEVTTVIKAVSKFMGKTIIYNDKELKGKKITIVSSGNYTAGEAYRIFEKVLEVNDLSIFENGPLLQIQSEKFAKTTPADVMNKSMGPGSYVTRVIPLQRSQARNIRSALAPLISKQAVLIGVEGPNVLILKDTKENTDRFVEVVRIMEEEEGQLITQVQLEIVTLQHADAKQMAVTMDQVFGVAEFKNSPEGYKFKAVADERTNQLLLIGLPSSISKAKMVIEQLDNPVVGKGASIRVYELKNADAKNVGDVLDKFGKTLVQSKKNAGHVKELNPITVIADIPSNSLIIHADKSDFPAVENVILQLDVERPQVFIQALIMEMKLDKSLDLGLDWQAGALVNEGTDTEAVVGAGGVGSNSGVRSFPATPSAGSVVGVVGGPITFNGTQYSSFSAFIRATQTDSEIDILSNPQILTLNNEEAEIKVGEVVPTIGSTKVDTNGNTTTTIDYKEVGVSLKITPQINTDGTITLKLEENNSNLVDEQLSSLYNQGAITTLNRSLKTKVVVRDGNTIALGGLISDQITTVEAKTPCLGDIPLLGWFFKSRRNQLNKTNLMIFLTPRVIRNEAELEEASKEAMDKLENAKQGRFRIDVSKEYRMPSIDRRDPDVIQEEKEKEAQDKAKAEKAKQEKAKQDKANQEKAK